MSNPVATSGPYYFWEYNSNLAKYNLKYFDGISVYQDVIIGGLELDRRYQYNITMNASAGTTSIKIYNSSGTIVTKGPFEFDPTTIVDNEYVVLQKGSITTYDRLYDFQAWNATWSPVTPGILAITLISPTVDGNVPKNLFTNFTVNITCLSETPGALCGDVAAYLDPRTVDWWFNSSRQFHSSAKTVSAGYREDFTNADWNTIYAALVNPWLSNPTGRLYLQFTDTTTGKNVVWVPWYKSDSSLAVSNLHDGNPAGSLACGSPTLTCNMQVTNKASGLSRWHTLEQNKSLMIP